MTERKNISTSWREGRYFDKWMVVHWLGGVTGGFSNVFFGLATLNVFLVGAGLMVVWEIAEYIGGIRESQENRVLDIVVGLLGVAIAVASAAWLSPNRERLAFVASGLCFGLGSFFGWAAHQKRRRGS